MEKESDVVGDDEEAAVEEFTLDRFNDFSQSIAARSTLNNKRV